MTRQIVLSIACFCATLSDARAQRLPGITANEKAAASAMLADSKAVFDEARDTAQAAAAHVDIETTHRNLRDFESIISSSISHEVTLHVPATLESQHGRLLVSLRELRAGTRLQLSYWSNDDLSVIEKGQTKIAEGLKDLNTFINEMNGFLAQRAPSASAASTTSSESDSGGI